MAATNSFSNGRKAKPPVMDRLLTVNASDNAHDSMLPQDPSESALEKRGEQGSTEDRFEAWWILESACLLASVACLILIITVLKIHDGQLFSSWTFYFSLNTVVSVLAAITRSALIVAVSASLAQGKWIRFRKRNDTVNMFEIIDSASRETLGSFRLLWHTKGRHLIALGALVAILSIGIEPSLQALISDSGRLDPVEAHPVASIGTAEIFDGGTQCVDQTSPIQYDPVEEKALNQNVTTTPDFSISAALFDGLSAAGGGILRDVNFNCSSGNCTWSLYASLAVCSSCFNITNHLVPSSVEPEVVSCPPKYGATRLSTVVARRDTDSMAASTTSSMPAATTAPNSLAPITGSTCSDPDDDSDNFKKAAEMYSLDYLGLDLQNYVGKWKDTGFGLGTVMKATVGADPNATINFKDSQTLLAAFTVIRASEGYANNTLGWGTHGTVTAMECGLSLCLKVYNSSVQSGRLIENVTNVASKKLPNSWLPLPDAQQPLKESLSNLSTAVLGSPEWNPVYHPVYLAREDYQLDPTPLQATGFQAKGTQFNITQKALDSTVAYLTSLIPHAANQSTVNITWAAPVFGTPILQPLYDLADMEATFNKVASSLSNALRDTGDASIPGTTQQWDIHYRIRWAWLALPVTLVLIGTLFHIVSIYETHRARLPAWKTNLMATMLHGPDDPLRTRMRDASSQEKSLEKAGEIVATLDEQDSGISLTAVPNTPGEEEKSNNSKGRASVMTFATSETLRVPKLREPSMSSVETLVDREGRRSDWLQYEPDDVSLSMLLSHQV